MSRWPFPCNPSLSYPRLPVTLFVRRRSPSVITPRATSPPCQPPTLIRHNAPFSKRLHSLRLCLTPICRFPYPTLQRTLDASCQSLHDLRRSKPNLLRAPIELTSRRVAVPADLSSRSRLGASRPLLPSTTFRGSISTPHILSGASSRSTSLGNITRVGLLLQKRHRSST